MTDLYGFELLRDEQIAEISTRALLYRHSKTGAELLSLVNADENKAFGIAFRTPPADSTGVAHRISPSTGTSRAASFPSTISASDRSVAKSSVRLPRALSRQIDPAAAAGAARPTSPSNIIVVTT